MSPEVGGRQSRLWRRALPFTWIVSSLIWAAVMIDTGEIVWPLAVWMATIFAPLSALHARNRRTKGSAHEDGSHPTTTRGVAGMRFSDRMEGIFTKQVEYALARKVVSASTYTLEWEK